MKILIAEDEAINQTLAGTLMNHWGYDFDMVSNGQEAVEQAQRNEGKYDLCLMDIDMPVMNGFEATKIIRKKLRYFPIMALTANPMSKSKFSEMGMDDFLGKPYQINELYNKINELAVKTYTFKTNKNIVFIKEEMPMDQQHAEEIRMLKKKGLVKVSFGTNVKDLILHKNTTNKISHDFNAKGNLMSVFLNHDPDRPTRCELYKEHCHITQTFLDDTDYENEFAQEKKEMEKYKTRTLKPNDKGDSVQITYPA